METEEVDATVVRVISETFNCHADQVLENTTAEDIDGWDSLKHTILMIRLQRALGVKIPESVAAEVATVGDLIRRLKELR